MRNLFLLMAMIFTIALTSCSSEDDESRRSVTQSKLQGIWKLESIISTNSNGVYSTTHYPESDFIITFSSDGTFSAKGGTTTYYIYDIVGTQKRHSDGDYLLDDFLEWNKWSMNSRYDDDDDIFITGNSYSGERYGVTFDNNYNSVTLWENGRSPRYNFNRVK